MWSSENLTKVRKKADSMKISVDHSVFFPATAAECAKVSNGLPEHTSHTSVGTYYIGKKNSKSRSKVKVDFDTAEPRSLYLRKPTKTRDNNKEGNRVMDSDSYSNSD